MTNTSNVPAKVVIAQRVRQSMEKRQRDLAKQEQRKIIYAAVDFLFHQKKASHGEHFRIFERIGH